MREKGSEAEGTNPTPDELLTGYMGLNETLEKILRSLDERGIPSTAARERLTIGDSDSDTETR